jgi:hypothetical protein
MAEVEETPDHFERTRTNRNVQPRTL